MWFENANGWSVDENWLYDVELTDEELAESNRMRDHVLEILGQRSLDPAAWPWPDLAFLEAKEWLH